MKKCDVCHREAVFSIIEDKKKVPLCLIHYSERKKGAFKENYGVAM